MSVSLSNKEQEILRLLLDAEKGLTASELAMRNINHNTANSVLRSLVKMGFVEVAEIVDSGKTLSRRYRTTAMGKEYAFQELSSRFHCIFNNLKKDVPVPKIFAGLIECEEDMQAVIEELEAMIAEKRKELDKGEE